MARVRCAASTILCDEWNACSFHKLTGLEPFFAPGLVATARTQCSPRQNPIPCADWPRSFAGQRGDAVALLEPLPQLRQLNADNSKADMPCLFDIDSPDDYKARNNRKLIHGPWTAGKNECLSVLDTSDWEFVAILSA